VEWGYARRTACESTHPRSKLSKKRGKSLELCPFLPFYIPPFDYTTKIGGVKIWVARGLDKADKQTIQLCGNVKGNEMKIYGYYFKIIHEKGGSGYVAYAPGVGGIYEEGETKEEAISNAYEAACAILETRLERNDPIIEDNPHLKILTAIPNRQHIDSIKDIRDGYIVTPHCLVPTGV